MKEPGKLFDKLPSELKILAAEFVEEIYAAGFISGYQTGLYTFNRMPEDQFPVPAQRASHVSGTEAPQGETWEQMNAREIAQGKTS